MPVPGGGLIMSLLGLKPWEERMRAHAGPLRSWNFDYPMSPEIYYQLRRRRHRGHQRRGYYPNQWHRGRPNGRPEACEDGALLRYRDRERLRRVLEKEEQPARRCGLGSRIHGHPRHHRGRHHRRRRYEDEDEEEEEEDEEDSESDIDIDEYSEDEPSIYEGSYERTRQGHAHSRRPPARGRRTRHGHYPAHHGRVPHHLDPYGHGGGHGMWPMSHGGHRRPGFYRGDLYEDGLYNDDDESTLTY